MHPKISRVRVQKEGVAYGSTTVSVICAATRVRSEESAERRLRRMVDDLQAWTRVAGKWITIYNDHVIFTFSCCFKR